MIRLTEVYKLCENDEISTIVDDVIDTWVKNRRGDVNHEIVDDLKQSTVDLINDIHREHNDIDVVIDELEKGLKGFFYDAGATGKPHMLMKISQQDIGALAYKLATIVDVDIEEPGSIFDIRRPEQSLENS